MADAFTNNRNIVQPEVGADSGTWGGILNSGAMGQLDLVLGATEPVSISVADVTLSIAQWNNMAVLLTGALTADRNLILPLNANSTTIAVGGMIIVDNQTTGAFNLTVKTEAAGSTGVTVPQGLRSLLFTDTVDVWNADDSKLVFIPFSGNPNGLVAGTKGSVNNPPSVVWDYTNSILYVCTMTGVAATAVWTNIVASGAPLPVPQGYLTPVSNTPIITADSISAAVLYYTPFMGAWAAVHNGSTIIAFQFSQMQLTLSASQAANNIYDVFLAYNGGTPVIGTGPSWSAGGGTIGNGTSVRGTGAGSTSLTRSAATGLFVNTNSMSLIYNTGSGNNTITVGVAQGIYLGTILVDGTSGQITCHRSAGTARKWSIWNCYNRQPLRLIEQDPSVTWAYTTAAVRISNNNANNFAQIVTGLQESQVSVEFLQETQGGGGAGTFDTGPIIGAGFNSSAAFSGVPGYNLPTGTSNVFTQETASARQKQLCPLGQNTFWPLEFGGLNANFFGSTKMYFTAEWNG